mmetsp:Transcript_16240/g.34034  ORF Transcript_16240/g.34034 Transcript_16240/m.34034 type:complete len:86 (+) Transcript_16240:877-1134(+)
MLSSAAKPKTAIRNNPLNYSLASSLYKQSCCHVFLQMQEQLTQRRNGSFLLLVFHASSCGPLIHHQVVDPKENIYNGCLALRNES